MEVTVSMPEQVSHARRKGRAMREALPSQDEGGAFCDELQLRWLSQIAPQRDSMFDTGRYRTGGAMAFGLTWSRGFRVPPKLSRENLVMRADLLDVLMMTDKPFGGRRRGQISRLVLGQHPRLDGEELVVGGARGFLLGNFFKMPQEIGQQKRLRLRQSGKLINSFRKGKLYVRGMTDWVDLCVGLDRKTEQPVTIYRFSRHDLIGEQPLVTILGFSSDEIPPPGEIIESTVVEIGEEVAEAHQVVEIDTCMFNEQGSPKFCHVDPFAINRRYRRELKALLAMDEAINKGDYQVRQLKQIRCMIQFPSSLLGRMTTSSPDSFQVSTAMYAHLQQALGSGFTKLDGQDYKLQIISDAGGTVESIEPAEGERVLKLSGGHQQRLPLTAVLAVAIGDKVVPAQVLGDYCQRADDIPLAELQDEMGGEHFNELLEQFLLDQAIYDPKVAPGVLLHHHYCKSLLPLASQSLEGQPLWYLDLSALADYYDSDSGYLIVAIESLAFPLDSFNIDGLSFVFDHRSDQEATASSRRR